MNFYLKNKNGSSDLINFNEYDYYDHMILEHLKSLFAKNEDILEHLKNETLKVSKDINIRAPYISHNVYAEEEIFIINVSHYLREISFNSHVLYLNSVIHAAKAKNDLLPNIFILLFNLDKKDRSIPDMDIFDKESSALFISELSKAFEVERNYLNKSYVPIVNIIQKNPSHKELPFYSFMKEAKTTDNDYLFFSIEDNHFNQFSIYSSVIELDYKELISSESFKLFLKDNEIDNSYFNDMPDLFRIYFEDFKEGEDFMTREIIKEIQVNEKYKDLEITMDKIKLLEFKNKSHIFNI